MNYLTNYYKNLSEQLQEKVNHLQNLLNEVKITKVVNGKTVSWDPSVESEEDAEVRAGAYTAVEPRSGESKEDRSFRQGEANFQADAERAEEEKLKRDRSRQTSEISPSMSYKDSKERFLNTGSRDSSKTELSTAEERARLQTLRNMRGRGYDIKDVVPRLSTENQGPSSGRKQ
jgi:hypothetical protein